MKPSAFPYQNIVIIGTSGSGKSTLAEKLAQRLGIEYIELDALHFLPDWQELPDLEFRTRVETATRLPGWVIAGNYSIVRDISWPRAQAVIWLDYPFWTVFWRLWVRTWRRWWTHELLWGTNYERMLSQFKIWAPEESIFGWLFSTYWRRKREIPSLFKLPEYAHLKVFQMHSPRETALWLQNINARQDSSR